MPVPSTEFVYPAIVIGSGFGGAVAARRLTASGVETLIIERGRKWSTRDFPRSHAMPGKKAAFRSRRHPLTDDGHPMSGNAKFPGLLERIRPTDPHFMMPSEELDVTVAACYGGGSVVYGTMMLKPPPPLFSSMFHGQLSASTLARHYQTVKRAIGFGRLSSIPGLSLTDDYRGNRVFRKQASSAGYGPNLKGLETAVNWDRIRREGSSLPRAARNGEYILGCRSGAKNSVDKNYLQLAAAGGGLHVATTMEVTRIRRLGGTAARFAVECRYIGPNGRRSKAHTYWCDALFVCAGSMHTTRLLLQTKARGDIVGINAHLGRHWGDNGDILARRIFIGELAARHAMTGQQGGPSASAMFFGDDPDPTRWFRIVHTPGPDLFPRALLQLGMTVPRSLGKLVWNAGRGKVEIHATQLGQGKRRVMKVLEALNVANAGKIHDRLERQGRATYHPLGGCALGKVTDLRGRVRGVDGLYVVDGSLVPGHTGTCNPAWTIAALAEHCMADVVNDF